VLLVPLGLQAGGGRAGGVSSIKGKSAVARLVHGVSGATTSGQLLPVATGHWRVNRSE
jgi:hypothetical protein